MTTATINYLGKDYSYPLLTAGDLVQDRVVRLNNFEARQQGYELCYTETRRFHFLIRLEDLAKLEQDCAI